MLDPLKLYRSELDSLVGGETPLAAVPCEVTSDVATAGERGCCARRLCEALAAATMSYCVVTDSRVVFAEHAATGPFRELAVVPRDEVHRVRRAGRFLQRGRVVLEFADGSTLVLRTGMVLTGHARRLVAVLGSAAGPG